MSLLLDTSAVIRLFELARPDVVEAVRANGGEFAVSVVTLGELQRGVAGARTSEIAALRTETISLAVRRGRVITPTEDTARVWGTLAARLPRRVSANDLWIAATALDRGMTLASSDRELLAVMEGHPALRLDA